MRNKDLIEFILKGIAIDIEKDMAAKNLNASGRSVKSLKPVVNDNEGHLDGSSSIYFIIHGRKPGPFKDGIKTMMKWIQDKGITPKDSKTSLQSLAFLFARKVSQKGNDIFNGKRPGLAVKDIYSEWTRIFVQLFKENLKKEIYGVLNNK